MDVIFGVQATDRVLKVQLSDDEAKELRGKLEDAFSGKGEDRLLWVKDKSGAEIAIPVDKLAFVEFGVEKTDRQVGFSSAS